MFFLAFAPAIGSSSGSKSFVHLQCWFQTLIYHPSFLNHQDPSGDFSKALGTAISHARILIKTSCLLESSDHSWLQQHDGGASPDLRTFAKQPNTARNSNKVSNCYKTMKEIY